MTNTVDSLVFHLRFRRKKYNAPRANIAQSVEHTHGKGEVTGSIPVVGSSFALRCILFRYASVRSIEIFLYSLKSEKRPQQQSYNIRHHLHILWEWKREKVAFQIRIWVALFDTLSLHMVWYGGIIFPTMSLRLAFRYALYHIGSIVIFTTSLISHTSGLEPPPPPPWYVTGGLFMWYWQNLTSVGACPEWEAITGFSPLSGSYARPLCSEIYALKWVATAFGSGMTGSLNRLLKYTPDGEHVGNSSLFESGGRVGIGTDSPWAFLDSIWDILVNGVLIGRGGGWIISNLVVWGGGALFANISGGRNTVFWNNSLRSNTSGNGNTTHGYSALSENTFWNNNVGIGNQAGIGLTSGDNNIFLGYNTPPNIGPTASNQLNIGNWIFWYNGNIGIGVTNPQYRLDVGGDVNFASWVCIDWVCKDNWEDIGPWKNFGTSIAYTGWSVAIGGDFVSAPQYRVDVTGGYVNSSSGYCIWGDCRKTWNDVGYWTKNGTGIIYTGSAEVGDDFFVYGSGYIRDWLSLSGMLRVTGETYTDENIHSEKYVNGKIGLCMNYDCRTSWGTAWQWTNIGPTTIYYSGNVNIGNNFNAGGTGIVWGNFFVWGTTNIGGNTYVSGNISSSGYILSQSGFCLWGNCVNNWNQIVSNTLSWTQNYLAKFTPDGSHIGDSIVYESGGRVGIGTNTPRSTLELSGALSFGDFGSWYSGVVNRNWLWICKWCAGIPADSTTGNSVFHVSGVSNDSFGTTLSGQTTRVIGLFDTTLIGTSLGIWRGTLPREALDVNWSAVISDIFIGKGWGSILSNTAIWSGSLSQNGIGYQNTALWFHSLHSNTSGYQNTALWEWTLEANISGNVNTALWSHALYQNTIWNSNSAVWVNSLGINTIGSNNTAMWMYSLIQSTWNNNTALWYSVGSNLTAGNNNIFIWANVQPNISNIGSNQLNLGNWIYGNNGDIGIAIPTPWYRLDVAGGFANTSSGYCIAWDCRTSWASIAGGNINGTLNSLAKFTPTGQSIGNSQVFDDGTNVGIGTTTPSQRLDVNGSIHIASGITDTAGLRMDQNGGWFRTYGPTGWYNQTYWGWWHMNDTTWLRAYNNKSN